ncbi:hypothetical protein ACFSCW_03130 [Sphingomonas tabacisoli]|uniref:Uncharacterized protein n=1 Tax=Sphingomonas tabacisoli TaxID=2249466 RepID=A0ABW4I159_9SPHN
MLGKVIGALVGEEIGKRHGQGGKGAVLGVIAAGAMRRLGPLGLVLGGAYVAKKAYDRSREKA